MRVQDVTSNFEAKLNENNENELMDLFIRKTYEIYGANTDFDRGTTEGVGTQSFCDASYLNSVYEYHRIS